MLKNGSKKTTEPAVDQKIDQAASISKPESPELEFFKNDEKPADLRDLIEEFGRDIGAKLVAAGIEVEGKIQLSASTRRAIVAVDDKSAAGELLQKDGFTFRGMDAYEASSDRFRFCEVVLRQA